MTTPPPTSRVVRAFISSTFRDFGEERDLLVKRVFPELRRRARARFVEVIGVDLRWGITEEESQKGETLPICLREIERSRPYFIGLLGERYGWTPQAGQYPAELLERQPWLAEHAGGKSVTELEILHGVLNSPEMAGRAYFYFRDPAWSEGKGEGFRSEGEDERARLARLKERIRASPFPVAEYATPESLADRITEDLWRLIDAEYPESEVPDELERERRSHEAYAHERRRLYVGQEATVGALLARLEGASDEKGDGEARSRITLVTGESGTGKSALIANVLERYRQAHPTHVVIEHYIGSTSDAADPAKLMHRIAGEIRKLTGSTREIEEDPEKLAEQFAEWLAEASWWAGKRGVKVVVALDALDKLSGDGRLRWLPKSTAPHLRIVLSSLAGEARETLGNRGVDAVEARRFTPKVAREYLMETLARRGRRLAAREVDRIVTHPRATLPIYLKTLVEELSVFGSYEGLPQRITECLAAEEPDDLFEVILARVEGDLGEQKVRRPLEAIWASADGMSEDELVAFTGLSPLDLARLRLSLDDALYESGGLLRLAHAYMSKAVEDRYLPTEERKRALHKALGLWWERQEPTARMARGVCLHLHRASAWSDLQRGLLSPVSGKSILVFVHPVILERIWSSLAANASASVVGGYIEAAFSEIWSSWLQHSAVQHGRLLVLQKLAQFLAHAGCADGLAVVVARFAVRTAREEAAHSSTSDQLFDLAVSHAQLAQHLLARGENAAALREYREASAILRCASNGAGGTLAKSNLSAVLCECAEIELESADLDAALRSASEAVGIARGLGGDFDTTDDWLRLISALRVAARIQDFRSEPEAACETLIEALEVARHLVDQTWGLEAAEACLSLVSEHARIMEKHGELTPAQAGYVESCRLAAAIAEFIPSRRNIYKYVGALDDLGRVLEARGDLQTALSCHHKSLAVLTQPPAESETPEGKRAVCACLDSIAHIEEMTNDLIAARVRRQQISEQLWSLVQEFGSALHLKGLMVGLVRLADVEEAIGDLEAARQSFEAAVTAGYRLIQEVGLTEDQPSLMSALDGVVRIDVARGDIDAALAACWRGISLQKQFLTVRESGGRRLDLSASLVGLAEIERAGGDLVAALESSSESLEIGRRQFAGNGTTQALNSWIWSTHLAASCLVDLGRYDEALLLLEEVQARAEDLESSCDDDLNILDTCAAYHETRAKACAALGRADDAQHSAEKAAEIRASIEELSDDADGDETKP
jgi:tetratricopeptide (TPR) repeat protein